jgi:hypothetical protein
MTIGIYNDWRHPEFLDLNFRETAVAFERAAPGSHYPDKSELAHAAYQEAVGSDCCCTEGS